MNKLNGPLIADINGLELDAVDKEFLQHPKLGGIILFSRNYESREQVSALVRTIREIRPNLFICVDHEGGRVQRFRKEFSCIPPMNMLGRMYQEGQDSALGLSTDIGWLMAAELTSLDIDHSFAPILDLDDSKSRVIGDRAFSASAAPAIALARAFIKGMNHAGMSATAKHYPGHGGVVADSHLELPIDTRSLNDLLEHDLKPFESLKDDYAGLMTAHIAFPKEDALPVSFSSYWLQDILRQKLGYSGVIFSDDLSMKGADNIGDFTQRSLYAIDAGCDVILVCNQRAEAELTLEFLERKQIGEHGKLELLKHSANTVTVLDRDRQAQVQTLIEESVQRYV